MLSDFMDTQFVAFSLLNNAIKNNRLSHAYLIDGNNYERTFDFALAFVKSILCKNLSNDGCGNCSLCQRIDNNNYSELKIIQSDTSVIKKEQLLDLQTDFSKLSIEGDFRIYIIKDCDKMNKQASNCLLKFLEEPDSNVIAILVTNNFSKVLSTIVSRCQIIRLNNSVSLRNSNTLENLALILCDKKSDYNSFLEDVSKSEVIESVINILEYIEEYGLDILLYTKKMWYNRFQTRDDSKIALMLMVYFYYDLLQFKLANDIFFCDKLELVEKYSNKNSIESIIKKLDIVVYGFEMLDYNLNLNLLLDDILIRLGDVE